MKRTEVSTLGSDGGGWRHSITRIASAVVYVGVAITLVGVSGGSAVAANSAAEPDLLEAEKAFPVTARRVSENAVELRYTIAPGYYMYRDRFRFSVNGQPVLLTKKSWPAGKWKQDATFGKVVTYRNSVHLLLPLTAIQRVADQGATATARGLLNITATSQGCADAGVCYPPLKQTLVIATESSGWVQPHEAAASGFSRDRSLGGALSEQLLTRGK